MRRSLRRGLFALALALTAASVVGHVRLRTSGGNPLFWQNDDDVSIVVSSAGSDDIQDESETAAIRLAIAEWNAVNGSTARLIENTSAIERARTDWDETDIHLVLFDEDDSSGFFPGGTRTVALTPLWFSSSGKITDADVLFNGVDWSFTTTGEPGSFDVQDVAAHELGHVLGLDHSAWGGATMYPFVDQSITAHRSVSLDEVAGLREAYPTQTFGRLRGTVERGDGSPVAGAHVVARNAAGRTVGGALTDEDGDYLLPGLPPDTYTVYAVPVVLDPGNFGDAPALASDFEATPYGAGAVIAAAESLNLGTLVVDGAVAVSLGNPSLDLMPIVATAGEMTGAVVLSGTGLVNGSTLVASDPDVSITNVIFASGSVLFFVDVPSNELPGHVDLTVTAPGGAQSTLPAAIEIVAAQPEVDQIDPDSGASAGGTAVTITGDGFRAGARVVIGDQVYEDGVDATVANAQTIALTTRATFGGTHDVVVLDPSGVEGRLAAGFATAVLPVVQTLFPTSGSDAGGTHVVVTGTDFVAGLEVRIAGVAQTVDAVTATRVDFTTVASVAPLGVAQTVEIENPDGEIATSSFTFTGQADPVLVSLLPTQGSSKGGDTIVLSGTDLPDDAEVVFGVDPLTGDGGTAAAQVTFVGATSLEVVTPALAKGTVAVLVRDMSTGQTAILPAAFTFQGSSGGGGGCSVRPLETPPAPPLDGAWWMLGLLALLALRALRAGRRAAPAGLA